MKANKETVRRGMTAVAALLIAVANAAAQGPNDSGTYYEAADGTSGRGLKTAMAAIINGHTVLSYDYLWECFYTTDRRDDGTVWDMYSDTTNYIMGGPEKGVNYKKEGDSYNREHSMPKSWFGNKSPMNTDLMHIVPTDGYVNGRRSNYPFGETEGETYQSEGGFSKLGRSTTAGYSGTVFEPADEYKGDFARIYFYMVTCYEDVVSTWSSDMLDGTAYPAFATWALDMLLRWAEADPVSQKEIDRNEAVWQLQHNRNPFVDYPGLEQYVWGGKLTEAFSYDTYGGSSTSGIVTVGGSPSGFVTVYTTTGVAVRSGVSRAEALCGLPKGIYIIGAKKYAVR